MKRLWFVMPVHGREAVTAVCLRQLRRTCDTLNTKGFDASAVVVGDDSSVDLAGELGFATVRRDNRQLGRKFNDGYQLACDPDYNPRPVDYVVPVGSDDWVDPAIFGRLPSRHAIGVFRRLAVVDEHRERLAKLHITYRGGAGIRIIPRQLIQQANYRPSDEDRKRAIDTSTLVGITRANRAQMPPLAVLDVHPLQIVDWKTAGTQLNTYDSLKAYSKEETTEVWSELAQVYPAESLEEMAAL